MIKQRLCVFVDLLMHAVLGLTSLEGMNNQSINESIKARAPTPDCHYVLPDDHGDPYHFLH